MPLPTGTRLGAYEVVAPLGAGGMGEVYRARDTRLGRDVAIKVVSAAFTGDPERVARFEREAQLLASLNHPHIATVHGLEQAGAAQCLVMEVVEGETLGGRLQNGALPIAEAVAIASQIADALQAAHEKGIIHRDLKPANIALTAEGQVKVLDFGLAKTLDPAPAGDAANSPTLTLAATQAGVILGTAAYMAPEQAKGKAADKRSDVWAFGCVLYEMLTGRRAFDGDDVSDTMAAVLRGEPDWSALPSSLPPHVRTLVQRCLTKDPRRRIPEMAAVLFLLIDVPDLAPPAAPVASTASASSRWRRLIPVAAAAAAGAALVATPAVLLTRPAPPPVSRLAVIAPPGSALGISGNDRDLAIAPDGSRIAYVAPGGTIMVRPLDRLEATPLPGLGSPRGLFFSPDGLWIGFADGATGTLKKIPVGGGPPMTLCTINGNPRGAVWLDTGVIVFATNDGETGLMSVAAGGGEPVVVTRPSAERGEVDHLWPEPAADAQRLIFTIVPRAGTVDTSQIAVLDLATRDYRVLLKGGSDGRQLPSGHLVYGASGAIRAVHGAAAGSEPASPSVVLPEVGMTSFGSANFDVALNGTVVYSPGGAATMRTLAWVDRQGREERIPAPPRAYLYPRLSPDGTRVALDVRDQESDIWIWSFSAATLTRLTFEASADRFPIWSADGRRVFFGSDRAGIANVYAQAADGTGGVERLADAKMMQMPMSAAPDGRTLVIRTAAQIQDLMLLPLDGKGQPQPLIATPFVEQNAEVSPDGRWLAYESSDSGQFEVFVRPFPNVGAGKWQVSTGGGMQPAWSRDGRELFYLASNGALMGARVDAARGWSASAPVKLFEGRYYHGGGAGGGAGRTYDVSPDGRRFLMIKTGADGAASPPLIVVQNWIEELQRIVPVN